jgi:type IV pilus assembly protein PilX
MTAESAASLHQLFTCVTAPFKANRMRINMVSKKSQSGVVLIVCLLMLMLLTMLSVQAMQSTGLEEKMAGNMRDRNLAFQAAESALKAGESFLGGKTKAQLDALVFDCVGTDGLFQELGRPGCAAGLANWDAIIWDANSAPIADDLANIRTKPRFIIEVLPCKTAVASGPCVAYVYRITARGTGGTDDALTIVQSIFEAPI